MRLKQLRNIVLAVLLSVVAGFGVQQWRDTPIECTDDALNRALARGGTIVLPRQCWIETDAVKVIIGNVTIRSEEAAILADFETPHRVFYVEQSATLRLDGIMVVGGRIENDGDDIRAGGAAILNRGRLELVRGFVYGNRTQNASGAGIYNDEPGQMLIADSKVASNYALGAPGAGIHNRGQAVIRNTIIDHNYASEVHMDCMAGIGGGIFNEGELLVANSTVHDNTASRFAGIANLARMTIRHSVISHNTAAAPNACSGDGAGFFNGGDAIATITGSSISDNRGAKYGAGIVNWGVLAIRDTRIATNDAFSIAGGIMNLFGAQLTIENSIIAGNTVQNNYRSGLANVGNDEYPAAANARNNYWGSPDGPGGDGPGNGDQIVGLEAEDFTPWLTDLPDWAR